MTPYLLLSLLLTSVAAVPSGAAAGMDLDLIKNIKNYVMPHIIAEINALQLPCIQYPNGHVDHLKLDFHLAGNDSVEFLLDPA